ncbi:hypothetical protein GCM10011400_10640 [Paraburkholderia caffeinilytica]|uniref:Uncharacterized protein n=1 Tax=Paraburkholderia caffeinilytica TaxID=1761016 RepID=A0ABQ1LQK9_9BURK|nr:hypothetical protein GCM10011400_10640 [Paraburkholderia caffeinilytica]
MPLAKAARVGVSGGRQSEIAIRPPGPMTTPRETWGAGIEIVPRLAEKISGSLGVETVMGQYFLTKKSARLPGNIRIP